MSEDLNDQILENAKGPKRAKGDQGEVEQHNLKDQIALDRYLRSKEAVKSKKRGFKITKLLPPGTV